MNSIGDENLYCIRDRFYCHVVASYTYVNACPTCWYNTGCDVDCVTKQIEKLFNYPTCAPYLFRGWVIMVIHNLWLLLTFYHILFDNFSLLLKQSGSYRIVLLTSICSYNSQIFTRLYGLLKQCRVLFNLSCYRLGVRFFLYSTLTLYF